MTPRSILVVDDEAGLARNIADLFHRRRGWASEVAFDGVTAVDRVRSSLFDVVLLDMRMPGMDGFETLHRIMELRTNACVVFYTAWRDVEHAIDAIWNGAADMVPKGLVFDQLFKVVEKAIERNSDKLKARETDRVNGILTLAFGMAHQVQNRLHGIGLRLDLIETDKTAEERLKHVRETKFLDGLAAQAISKLNEYARTQQGDSERRAVKLKSVVERSLEIARMKHIDTARSKALRIENRIADACMVLVDEQLLTEAIECVVDNAMEATRLQGGIQITATEENGLVRLLVEDDGPGFSPDWLDKAHEPFRTTKEKTNIGFGLFFAKHVAELCGGSLVYGNHQDRPGAWVRIVLPASASSEPPTP